jgi:hypothetical protein
MAGMIAGKYNGKVVDGVREAKQASLEWSNGDIYEGGFKNGLRHGYGKLTEQNGTRVYEGTWAMSQKEGKGVETFANGECFIVYYKNGYKLEALASKTISYQVSRGDTEQASTIGNPNTLQAGNIVSKNDLV